MSSGTYWKGYKYLVLEVLVGGGSSVFRSTQRTVGKLVEEKEGNLLEC